MIDEANEEVFAFWRRLEEDGKETKTALVLLNFTDRAVRFKIPIPKTVVGRQALKSAMLLLANYPEEKVSKIVLTEDEGGEASVVLEGYEGRIYLVGQGSVLDGGARVRL